ncbi:MBOAT family O-acyltransferase [Sphingosinicella microcystinivorans]|uniref:Probable alginate O-acetylase AlgI n=1 Tax=Sphingosinicella microcystinivorans TaxID=335406 RepID=A0AAD1D8Y4_SPHMI|nr:MBOAT family protein [Sphingosinicella microcystinivorans]RKS86429.1 D-alanyl-lipoteichoic acid acyltransferase DltB (MBOAT superfamily) [Sphingosinicella microcystinivorans]BBE35469.1 alginate O-acetylation protein [Sphingosinicella microcystinivorans]
MLFNSYEFILLFLPIAVAGFFVLAGASTRAAMGWLVAVSLFFYGWWNPAYLPLLIGIAAFNYVVGRALSRRPSRWLLGLGIAVDLGTLGYFKYAGFFVSTVDSLTGADWAIGPIVLPLAISFFTFQKIAFLVDSHRGLARDVGPLEYALFVAFFPQLIAGPIVHYRDVVPQFRLSETFRPIAENFAVGITIFAIGLFKKAVLADGIAVYATPVFDAAEAGRSPDLLTAWSAALAYTFQLYFDFSGYSDMAIGAARLFGIRLPLNFNSPYKAANIIDFWRRWHMTLSRFLRDYLYVPLGGNRKGRARRHANLLATMLLGGLWHGAGWTFVVWGALHGAFLIVNHAWRRFVPAALAGARLYPAAAWLLTFLVVVAAWVPFRAPTLDGAVRILAGMAGLNGVSLPAALFARLGPLRSGLETLGVEASVGGGGVFVATWLWIIILFALARFAPSTQQIMGRYRPGLGFEAAVAVRLSWRPAVRWAMFTGALAAAGLLALNQVSEFLYFQF